MKEKIVFILSYFIVTVVFSQEIIQKTFTSKKQHIAIDVTNLDAIQLITSDSSLFRIQFYDENPNTHFVYVNDSHPYNLTIAFQKGFLPTTDVFKKYITERLQRATAIIFIPKNKSVSITGKAVDVISKSYNGNLSISIDKGLVKLGELQQNADVKLFQGNVYAQITNNFQLKLKSNKGIIQVDDTKYTAFFQRNTSLKQYKKITISSIVANIFLSTK